jgi:hypothetical protein
MRQTNRAEQLQMIPRVPPPPVVTLTPPTAVGCREVIAQLAIQVADYIEANNAHHNEDNDHDSKQHDV